MRLSRIDQFGVFLLFFATSAVAEEPTCRWLNLDETKVYQCAVLPPEVTASEVSDELPDPTLPLAKQRFSQPASLPTGVKMKPPAKVRTSKVFQRQFLVLGVGDVDSNKAKLLASNDHDFAFLPSYNQLSLGVFSKKSNALNRQETLDALGIQTVVQELGGKPVEKNSAEVAKTESQSQQSHAQMKKDEQAMPASDIVKVSSSNNFDMPQTVKQSRTVSGYIVVSLGDAAEALDKLQDIGAKDFLLMRRGPYKNRVSVGVYAKLDRALARQTYFEKQGLDSDVVLRSEQRVVSSSRDRKSYETHPIEQIALIPLGI